MPPSRTCAGPRSVAPTVVTPRAARSFPRAACKCSRFPSPFCSVSATPSLAMQPASWAAVRSVCQDLTRTNTRRAPRQSEGAEVTRTRTVCDVPSDSRRIPSRPSAANPSGQLPRRVTSVCGASRAPNKHAMAPVPAMRSGSDCILVGESGLRVLIHSSQEVLPVFVRHFYAMFNGWELPRLHVGREGRERTRHFPMEVGVFADELGRETVEEPQEIVRDQTLAIAASPGADADRGDLKPLRDPPSQSSGDRLEDEGKTTRRLKLEGVIHQPLGCLCRLRLSLEAAELMNGLWCQSEVAHDRDPRRDNRLDRLPPFATAFEFDRIHAGFLQEPPGVANRLEHGHLVRHERHVPDQHRRVRTACYCLAVVQHVLHGYRERGFIAQYNHTQGVTHQDGIQASPIDGLSRGVVVRGEHRDGQALRLLLAKDPSGDFFSS